MVAKCNPLCHSALRIATDLRETTMIARMWRGWTAVDSADRVVADLREGVVTRYRAAAGNVSAEILRRPVAGGVELMVISLWESAAAAPARVEENHRLLVARETVPALWELLAAPQPVVAAA
jgi:hypothetical protein